jgi:hypothetical protein
LAEVAAEVRSGSDVDTAAEESFELEPERGDAE